MSEWYVLNDDNTIRPCDDFLEGARFLEQTERRIVRKTDIGESVRISTVFLGLNHQYGDGPPLVFETMVFGGPLNEEMDRYSSWAEAEEGYAKMVARCEAGA